MFERGRYENGVGLEAIDSVALRHKHDELPPASAGGRGIYKFGFSQKIFDLISAKAERWWHIGPRAKAGGNSCCDDLAVRLTELRRRRDLGSGLIT